MAKRDGYRWLRSAWQPSPAERRVLDELVAGRTNAEIAVRLGLSPETVKSHVARLIGETGCADRRALANWWQSQRRQPQAFVPLLALMARFARVGLIVAVGVAMLVAIAGLASRGQEAPTVPLSLSGPTSTPTVTPVRPAAAGGLYDIGLFIISAGGAVQAENRAAASAVSLAAGDLVQFPSGMRWEPPPGVSISLEYGLAASATVMGTKLYVWVQTGGDTARFERLDDRTFRVIAAGTVVLWAEDGNRADHRVAVDAAGHLLLDPAPVVGSVVAIYGSGEGLDVSGMAMVGHLAPVRRTQYPTEWYFNMCDAARCSLSYRVGPLRAPAAGTVVCEQGSEFDFDLGSVRLQFRDAGTLRNNPTWFGPDPAACGADRMVQANEIITESFAHYIVSAIGPGGEPLSVAVAYDGTLYVGQLVASAACPPCRGN